MARASDKRPQKAVLWAFSTHDRSGNVTVSAASEIDVRWVDKKTEAKDANGNTVIYDATVVVGQDITPGSIMWLGAQADLPSAMTNLYQVVEFSKTPSHKALYYRRTVMLMRYRNRLPTITS